MKNVIKKITVITLACIMILAMSIAAFAGSRTTKKEAVNIALKDAGVTRSQVRGLDTDREDGSFEIEFKVKKSKTEYNYEISSAGTILEKSVEYRYKHNSSRKKVGKAAAIKAVAKHLGISKSVVGAGTCIYEYDRGDREGTYDVEFDYDGYDYEFEVLAPTGKIIEYSKEASA